MDRTRSTPAVSDGGLGAGARSRRVDNEAAAFASRCFGITTTILPRVEQPLTGLTIRPWTGDARNWVGLAHGARPKSGVILCRRLSAARGPEVHRHNS